MSENRHRGIEAQRHKGIVISILITVILAGVCFAGDPNGPVVKPKLALKPTISKKVAPPAPMRLRVLPKTSAQAREFSRWQASYGTSDTTQLYYNLAALLNGLERHGTLIDRNRDYIVMILSPDDPNSLASVVVKNRRFIDVLIRQNGQLARRLTRMEAEVNVEMQMKELSMRVESLEKNNTKNMIGEKDATRTNGIPKAAGDSESADDKPAAVEGCLDRVDSQDDGTGSGRGATGSSGDPNETDDTDGGT